MRRVVVALVLSWVIAGVAGVPVAGAEAGVPPDDARRGVVHRGLRPSRPAGPCRDGHELEHPHSGRTSCTHGPDPAPDGVDVRLVRQPQAAGPAPAGPSTAAAGLVPCDGDGTTGPRVQLVYARAADRVDRYTAFQATFGQIAAQLDKVFVQSAAETDGVRHVRFVTDSSCAPVVSRAVLSATGDDDLDATISDLTAQGYTRSDRKYLVWVDANVYCGIAEVYRDDRPTSDNYNNGNPVIPGMFARVDNGCWGQSNPVEAHELMHTLGGVQPGAPHGTSRQHCTDEFDRMCYSDGSGATVSTVCPQAAHEALFDCNHDDYFTTARTPAPYLATHWNTAASAFLTSTGTTSSWGYNGQGQLGDGTTTTGLAARQVVTGAVAVGAGADHSLAVKGDGTVLAWGGNAYGQLGDGSTVTRLVPTVVPGLTGVTAVAAGAYHSLALRDDGTVWAWGLNALGELGDGTTTDHQSPAQVTGLTGVVAVAAGALHSLAVRNDGTVWAWGWNATGQLGDGSTTDRHGPVQVAGLTGVTSVAAGLYHTLALRSDGTVRAWGWNGAGQLGDGTTTDRHAPVAVAGLTQIAGIAAGYYHSIAFTRTGAVGAWGWNGAGQLGDGTTTDRHYAVHVIGLSGGVRRVAAGAYHSLAVTSGGTVTAWGWNYYGQLGDGTTVQRNAPTPAAGPVAAVEVAGGGYHTLTA